MRPTTGGSPARRRAASSSATGPACERHDRPGQLEQRQRAAADLAPPPARPRRPRSPRRASRARRGAAPRGPRRASPAPGSRAARARARGRAAASPRAPRGRACRAAAPAPAGGARAGGDRVRAPDHQAGLRPAEQLVAREADERRARARPSGAPAAPRAGPRARPATPEPTSSITGTPSSHSSSIATSSTNPSWRKFDGCARSSAPVRSPIARLVVGAPRAVGRADLDQPRARLRDHLRHAEAAADLDQLPARDDDLRARPGQRRRRQQHRAGAVVDRQRRLGAGQLAQQRPRRGACREPRAPPSRSHSRFE